MLLSLAAASLQQQPLQPLTKYRGACAVAVIWLTCAALPGSACIAGQTHRKTVDGRLCAAAYVHNSQAFTVRTHLVMVLQLCLPGCQDCTSAANPDGVSGREWCYVEALQRHFFYLALLGLTRSHFEDQVGNAGAQKWVRLRGVWRLCELWNGLLRITAPQKQIMQMSGGGWVKPLQKKQMRSRMPPRWCKVCRRRLHGSWGRLTLNAVSGPCYSQGMLSGSAAEQPQPEHGEQGTCVWARSFGALSCAQMLSYVLVRTWLSQLVSLGFAGTWLQLCI